MRFTRHARRTTARAAALLVATALQAALACADATPPGRDGAPVSVAVQASAAAAATTGMSVTVTGPGIATPVVANLVLDGTRFAGSITVPAGSDRLVTVRAFDANGIQTHEGVTTVHVRPRENIALAITLLPLGGGVPIEVTVSTFAVAVAPDTLTLSAGAAATRLTATVTGVGGSAVAAPQLQWGSTNPVVASVDSAGVVTPGRPGETQVVANFRGIAAAATVRVVGHPVGLMVRSPADTITAGRSYQLTATLHDAAGHEIGGHAVRWASSDSAVLRVDSAGVATGVRPGSATVAAAVAGGSTATLSLTVWGEWQLVQPGWFATCALSGAGRTYCWGSNAHGQLGDGTLTTRPTPAPVAGAPRFTQLAVGVHHACGLTATGAAHCWGRNDRGQLGDGTLDRRTVPGPVAGGHVFVSLAAGSHSCALTATGEAYCWGPPQGTQADGDHSTRPAPVARGHTFASLTVGNAHACALTAGGEAYCWGWNFIGQLGDGTRTNSLAPVRVSGGLRFRQISAGFAATCGVTTGGDAYCWGTNSDGQLGDGTTANRYPPTRVSGGHTFASVRAAHNAPACALTTEGAAYCWGAAVAGSVGDGSTSGMAMSPRAVAGGLRFASLSVGMLSACGVTPAGEGYCWGARYDDENGQPVPIGRSPTRVPLP